MKRSSRSLVTGLACSFAALALAGAGPETAAAATFTVTNLSNSPSVAGSLPWAVQQANATSALDTINFNIPGGAHQIIRLAAALDVTRPVTIDGLTQPGYNGGAGRVWVTGHDNGLSVLFGLHAGSGGSTIRGLGLFGYTNMAVLFFGSSDFTTIDRNYIGFYTDGAGVLRNSDVFSGFFTHGLFIQSGNNVIIQNVISGVDNAVVVGETPPAWSGLVYTANRLQGNFIGTNPGGTTCAGYGNRGDAIFLGSGARNTRVGPANIISCNGSSGVEMLHSSNQGNLIFYNAIGTNLAGNATLGNGDPGILISGGAAWNTVGGTTCGQSVCGNQIAGNGTAGISLGEATFGGTTNNTVVGNLVGANRSQTAALPGQLHGVFLQGSSGNTVNGNVVAGNQVHGIFLANGSQFNQVSQNWIGRSQSGTAIANGDIGLVFVNSSCQNTASGNLFGSNPGGNVFQDQPCNTIN